MERGQSPTADGQLTARTIEVAEPSAYDGRKVKQIRSRLNVSQAVFASLVGVSTVLVRSWERGARLPTPMANRLLDQIRRNPEQFVAMINATSPALASDPSPKRRPTRESGHHGKRARKRAA